MKCQNCGFEFAIGPSSCPNCGNKVVFPGYVSSDGGWQAHSQSNMNWNNSPLYSGYGQSGEQQDPRNRHHDPGPAQNKSQGYPPYAGQDSDGNPSYAGQGQDMYPSYAGQGTDRYPSFEGNNADRYPGQAQSGENPHELYGVYGVGFNTTPASDGMQKNPARNHEMPDGVQYMNPQNQDPRTREVMKKHGQADPGTRPMPQQGNSGIQHRQDAGAVMPESPNDHDNEEDGNGSGIAALIFGLISFIVVPVVTSIMAIAFGNISIRKHGKNGLARAGKILGAISLILYACLIILYVLVLTGTVSLL